MPNSFPTLTNILSHDANQVGHKFRRLGQIAKTGFSCPDFFCLPRSLFDTHYEEIKNQIAPLLEQLDQGNQSSFARVERLILEAFQKMSISPALQADIESAFDSLFVPTELVAVRATIIGDKISQGEDGVLEPFAGMSESFLNVKRSELIYRIQQCWASGFSQQALLYRLQQDYDATGFGVAVAVQKMVESTTSFVAFSCDPQTQAQESVIAGGKGLGELVVQEKTGIQHFRVDHRTGQISMHDVYGEIFLSSAEIHLIDNALRNLERTFEHPQDVEGSFDQDGQLFILQSRPIAIEQNRYRLWSNANISESFPGTTTPLTFSVAKRFYADLNRDYYRRCGVSKTAMNSVDHAFDRLLGFLDGRIYHCITNFQITTAIHPLSRFFESDYDQFVCELDKNYRRPNPARQQRSLSNWGRIIWAAMIAIFHYFTLPWKFWRFSIWWQRLRSTVEKKPSEPSGANHNLDSLDRIWSEASRQWGITLINYQQMVFFHSMAEKLLGRWCRDPKATFAELLSDGNRLFGSEVVARALELADLIRSKNDLAEQFVELPAEKIWMLIESGSFDSEISERIHSHLRQFGVRGLEELKMEVPNLRDQPEEFIRILQNYLSGKQRYSDLVDREQNQLRNGLWRFAKSVYFNPYKVYMVALAIRSLRKALERREIGRYMRGELFGMTKDHLFAIADELVSRDCIDEKNDILHLTIDEIRDFVEGRSCTQNLRAIVEIRQCEAVRFSQKNPRKEVSTYGLVYQSIAQEPSKNISDTQIRGLGSCVGVVRGRARVVRNPRLSDNFHEDEILVAPETDPGWLYLMLNAKGIVVERGSLLSHTAITGRRFAIPTVVAAKDACRIIADGDEIQIDGQTGIVEILNKASQLEDHSQKLQPVKSTLE